MLRLRPPLRLFSARKNDHNQAIIDFLRKFQEEEEAKSDSNAFKVHAYSRAIHSVSQVDKPIQNGNQVVTLQGIGPKIALKINEFLYTEPTLEAHHLELQSQIAASRIQLMLQTVPDIGPVTAKKLVAAGCTSISDLRDPRFSKFLSTNQALQVKYMGHLEQPVLREDAEDVLNFMRESLDSTCDISLVGDYRRGAVSSSAINIMISHPDFVHIPLPTDASPFAPSPEKPTTKRGKRSKKEENESFLLNNIIPSLDQRALVADTFKKGRRTWEGIIRLPETHGDWGTRSDRISGIENVEGRFRKMTIHLVPQKSVAASLLYLTGDSQFYFQLCRQAGEAGMLLNEYGLWKWNMNDPTPVTTNAELEDAAANKEVEDADAAQNIQLHKGYWSLVNTLTEEDIFTELGSDFVDPTKRNFSFVSGRAKRGGTSKRTKFS